MNCDTEVAQASSDSSGTNVSTGYVTQYPDPHLENSEHCNEIHPQDLKLVTAGDLVENDAEMPKYSVYPVSKPFINTDYVRADRPVSLFPESNRDAVISALRNLQDKIKKLETERNLAEQNLQVLASETEQYRQLLKSGRRHRAESKHHEVPTDGGDAVTSESRGQLSSVEHRCQLLEKQLGQVRRMVENSEQSRSDLMENMRRTQQNRAVPGEDMKVYMERLNDLERDQRRLTGTQQLSEVKIRELELKVREEKMYRETLQEKTSQLESATQSRKSPSSQIAFAQVWKTKKPSKKKKTPPSGHTRTRRAEPMKHFRLNLADIPFVAGKSTGPSHSLGANVQKVLAMMKMHNPVLCSQIYPDWDSLGTDDPSSADSSRGSIERDLSDLLSQLQDEFGQLSSKHQEVVDKMHAAYGIRDRSKLEQELRELQQNLENKSQQISKIMQHQRKVENMKRSRSLSAKGTKSKAPATPTNNQPLYSTSISNGVSGTRRHKCSESLRNSAERPELFMLRDMKKLQRTLQKEDLYWE